MPEDQPRRARCASRRTATLRPSRCGSLRSRITAKVISPASTATANRSSINPMNAQCPIHGIANVRLNRSPYDSMIVSSKHREAPERQGMRHARHRPLQQLALPDHLDGLRRHVPAGMHAHRRDPLRSGLPAHRQPLQPPQPAPGDRERDHGQDQADGHPQDHANLLSIRSSSVAAQARRNMITSAQPRAPARTGASAVRWAALARIRSGVTDGCAIEPMIRA